jgi:hypothetical protein
VLEVETETAGAPAAAPAGAEPAGADVADLLLDIENLSDEQVEKLFASRVTGPGV